MRETSPAGASSTPGAPPSRSAETPVATPAPRSRRMAWLDAVRGFAALCVVFSHLSFHDLQSLRGPVYDVFDPGLYGVFVFFLVSGYIVPGSLERKGSIRSFWLSRVFRLFPLFAVALAAIFVLHPFGYTTFSSSDQHPVATVLAHMFMLNDLLGVTNLINVLWTLSYEMVFYLLITALFTVGAHQRSGRIALVFACAALALGGLLPSGWFAAQGVNLTQVAIIADALIIGGLAAVCRADLRRRAGRAQPAGPVRAGLAGLLRAHLLPGGSAHAAARPPRRPANGRPLRPRPADRLACRARAAAGHGRVTWRRRFRPPDPQGRRHDLASCLAGHPAPAA
jgi:peptidoglycan/LPS O-acetylase OafA/YrhL